MNFKINNYKQFVIVLLLIIFILPVSSCGKKTEKQFTVGIICGLDHFAGAIDGFKSKMTELGYIEGKNITYNIKKTNSNINEYQTFAQEFVAEKVDLIFGFPTEAALELKKATEGTKIPVIFAITNIEETNLINNVREPGGNLSGVRYPGPDLALKRFDILHQIAPNAKRILVPYADIPVVYPQLEALRPVATEAGVTLIEVPAKTPQDIHDYFKKHDKNKIEFDAILSIAEVYSILPETFLTMIKFANKHNIPMGGAYMNTQGYSSLFGVTIDVTVSGNKAAVLADMVLKGQPVGKVPVVSDDNYIIINYKEAQNRGYNIPEAVLSEANEIIK